MRNDGHLSSTLFLNGSAWLRADFHLHTKADREFTYSGEDDYYFSNYVQGLEDAFISVGVIANHNKFDYDEFKALMKIAKKKNIFLLPGVELSVNDGANGIHTVIVFGNEWLENGKDHINPFLTIAFEGKTPNEYEHENSRSSLGLIDTIKKLEGYQKDFFIVFAHVEARSGLWHELDGGRIQELGNNEIFNRRVLGFQKVRTHDVSEKKCRVKVKEWLGPSYPAEVEGSDCKAIDQIGQGDHQSYIKIGYFSFEAVKYALIDFHHHVATEQAKPEKSHILSMTFEGGVLNGETIHLSPDLNTLIGIRGSGKSSILEALRYSLDIPFGEKAQDREYKHNLVAHTLGSGGKITVRAIDRRGQEYEIRRIYKEHPDVYVGGILQPGIAIRETILQKPIYFGQKDLSSSGEGFEKDLVEKLVGENLYNLRSKIDSQRQTVSEIVEQYKKLSNIEDKKREYEQKQSDAEYRLGFYKKHGVEEKLEKQIDFDTDSRKCSQITKLIKTYLTELEGFINQYEDDLNSHHVYQSKQNETFFESFFSAYDKLLESFAQIKEAFVIGKTILAELDDKSHEFEEVKEGLKEEFASIERKLNEELKGTGAKAIRPDEFRQLRNTVEQTIQMLEMLEKAESERARLQAELLKELTALNDLWHEEYRAIKTELDKVNMKHSSLKINAEFKGDQDAFVIYMKEMFRGSRIRETTFESLARKYTDFGLIYKNIDQVKDTIGGSGSIFKEYFVESLSAFLTWQIPNKYTIEYRGKELKHHSLGQRASALILFVLSQQVNDVIIIDQPEDDLDNQTIYEDVIKLIRILKPNTQFIFATHNANFPVLGDVEQIISTTYSDDTITLLSGSIDNPKLQKKIIDIMEGGEEAFRQRKRRYEIWKPQSS